MIKGEKMKRFILCVFVMASLVGCRPPIEEISEDPVPIPPPGVQEEVEAEVEETEAPDPVEVKETE